MHKNALLIEELEEIKKELNSKKNRTDLEEKQLHAVTAQIKRAKQNG